MSKVPKFFLGHYIITQGWKESLTNNDFMDCELYQNDKFMQIKKAKRFLFLTIYDKM